MPPNSSKLSPTSQSCQHFKISIFEWIRFGLIQHWYLYFRMWQMTHKYRHMTRLRCDTNHILEFQSPFIEFDNSNIFNRIAAAWLEYVFGCVANNISQFKNYQKIICRKINSKCIPSSTDIIPRQPLLSPTHVKKVIFDRN